MTKAIDINGITGEVIERDMTADEIEEQKQRVKKQKNRLADEAARALVKQSVLEKLGLTADEVTALLS